MQKRSFKITFQLGAGYTGNSKVHVSNFVEQVIEEWIIARIEQGLPTVSGFLWFGKMLSPTEGGSDGAGRAATVARAGIYAGELSTSADAEREDEEVRETISALAETLKKRLGGQKVSASYRDESWAL